MSLTKVTISNNCPIVHSYSWMKPKLSARKFSSSVPEVLLFLFTSAFLFEISDHELCTRSYSREKKTRYLQPGLCNIWVQNFYFRGPSFCDFQDISNVHGRYYELHQHVLKIIDESHSNKLIFIVINHLLQILDGSSMSQKHHSACM